MNLWTTPHEELISAARRYTAAQRRAGVVLRATCPDGIPYTARTSAKVWSIKQIRAAVYQFKTEDLIGIRSTPDLDFTLTRAFAYRRYMERPPLRIWPIERWGA